MDDQPKIDPLAEMSGLDSEEMDALADLANQIDATQAVDAGAASDGLFQAVESPYEDKEQIKFDLADQPVEATSSGDNDAADATLAQGMLGVADDPQPGDLDWWPSDTGVQYPSPEQKEGTIGGPERLG